MFKHPEAWAKVWAKETGLPYEVAPDAVKRTSGTRVSVAVDPAAIASEQAVADTFADLKLILRRFSLTSARRTDGGDLTADHPEAAAAECRHGGDSTEQRRFGDHLDHDRRYARTAEFLSVVRGAWSGRPFDFDGAHHQVEGGLTALPPDPLPDIFFGGSSAAGPVAAAHADVHLTWGEPPAAVKEKIDWIRGLTEEQGRTVSFGIRLHTISRDSSREAWATADRLLGDLDPETIAAAQQALGRSESVGQPRMPALHGGSRDKLEISPNLWAGVGLVRGGAGTAPVGCHAEGADRIEEYHALGVEHFVLSGYPHLEEAYWFGEGVTPEPAARGLLSTVPASPSLGMAAANGRPAPRRAGRRCWSPEDADRSARKSGPVGEDPHPGDSW